MKNSNINSTFDWNVSKGDFFPNHHDYSKRHAQIIKRKKIEKYTVITFASLAAITILVLLTGLIAKL